MFKEKIEQVKSLIVKNKDTTTKKKIENLVVFLILLIVTIISIKIIWKNEKSDKIENTQNKQLAIQENINTNSNTINANEYNLEDELENILSKISGVGNVKVLITYSQTSELVTMYNENLKESTTEETDTNGGTRTIQETDVSKEIVYEETDGNQIPITQKVIMPKIEGAIILAEGGGNIEIKTNIIQAVVAVTGLGTHKVQVFEMKKN